jgi:hypothetical protein
MHKGITRLYFHLAHYSLACCKLCQDKDELFPHASSTKTSELDSMRHTLGKIQLCDYWIRIKTFLTLFYGAKRNRFDWNWTFLSNLFLFSLFIDVISFLPKLPAIMIFASFFKMLNYLEWMLHKKYKTTNTSNPVDFIFLIQKLSIFAYFWTTEEIYFKKGREIKNMLCLSQWCDNWTPFLLQV